jgi:hypothetical protein
MRAWMRSLAACLLLASCAPPSPSGGVPPQVIADLTGVTMALLRVEPLIVLRDPAAFTPAQKQTMEADLNRAVVALAKLSTGMPAAAGAGVALEIDGYLNKTVAVLAAVAPFVPILAPFSPALDAIDAVLPGVEAFVNRFFPPPVTSVAPHSAMMTRSVRIPAMTPAQGRRVLGIPVVR